MGSHRHVKGNDDWRLVHNDFGFVLKIEFKRFDQVSSRFLQRFALTCYLNFETARHEPTGVLRDRRSKSHWLIVTPPAFGALAMS